MFAQLADPYPYPQAYNDCREGESNPGNEQDGQGHGVGPILLLQWRGHVDPGGGSPEGVTGDLDSMQAALNAICGQATVRESIV